MKQLQILVSLVKRCQEILSFLAVIFISLQSFAQKPASSELEKMPADLETDFALSSLPPHVRGGATVYLLDPKKGYYIGRQGTNGFICFIVRTEWEWAEFRTDMATPISYDAEGARSIFPAYRDVEAMRASGKFTSLQIKDTMTSRYSKGFYKAPARPGISYMVAPIMRTHGGSSPNIITLSLPHYMFYAPYLTEADIGDNSSSGGPMILGNGNGPHGYIIVPAGVTEKAKILDENKELLKRLVDYKSYFRVEPGGTHH